MIHLAHIICGGCGTSTTIALGSAHAIACGTCKEEIVLGEAPLPGEFKDPSLNLVLETLGFTHEKAPMERNPTGYSHDVFDWGGTLVCTGDAGAVWMYLRSEGLYPKQRVLVVLPSGKEQTDLSGEIEDPRERSAHYLGEGDRIEGGFGTPE